MLPEIIIKIFHVLGLQNFVNYERMNSVEITLDSNEIVEDLSKFKRSKYRFVIESSLFSSNLQNDTNIIFITCNGLSHARKALIINSKLYKTLGVVYLSQIKNWDLVKGESKRSQVIFADSQYHTKSSHQGFAFTTKNVSELFNFTIALLEGKGNKITFPTNETKVPAIGFEIRVAK